MMRFPWNAISLCMIALTVLLACDGGGVDETAHPIVDPAPIPDGLLSDLETWLAEHGKPPVEYVRDLFVRHDVVLLGEQHRILHDLHFVHELLPVLHEAGVRGVATEFARRVDQHLLDSLVVAPEWDERLAREILFRQLPVWGYREYVDVFKVAWRINLDLPPGERPLRMIALNHSYDYSHIRTEADRDDPEVWSRVRGEQTEADWARPVIAAVEAGEKVLAHCGIHHAFSRYRQPRVENGRFLGWGVLRFGQALHEALGDRVVTVYLHAPWNTAAGYDPEFVHPAGGRLDAFMLARDGGPFAVGFDTGTSPLSALPIENAVYGHGYDRFTIADFCDGWIYTKPVGEFEVVHYIDDFVNEDNIEWARANSINPRMRSLSIEDYNDACRSYRRDFERFFGHLR
jgi:hypothetical protein